MRRYLILALLVLIGVPTVVWAATASTLLEFPGQPIRITLDGTTPVIEGTSADLSAHKKAVHISCVVSGQPVQLLLRVQKAPNGTFVDLITSNTAQNLATAVDALDLAAAVPGHPSPEKDEIDQAALEDGD